MSYSRWGDSVWYTYWSTHRKGGNSGDETRDNATFEVCTVGSFTAAELREDIEQCVNRAMEAHNKQCADHFRADEADRNELREYMREFLADVEERYPKEGRP